MTRARATAPPPPPDTGSPEARRSRTWRWTAITGVSLLVLVTVHMVAHHFVVEEIGGLRTYHQVLSYISHPVILTLESAFLVVVTVHAMLGMRSVLFDFGLSARAKRLVSRGLVLLGATTIAYGFVLLFTLAARA
jgi:succinate dehydrogenase hydrophobic anchor subunit